MTTPTDPEGTGANDDLPYLPPARRLPPPEPSAVEASMPPPGPNAVAQASTAVTSSAAGVPDARTRAFVDRADEQRRQQPEPAYGSLPTASDGGTAASQQLRIEAQRRRRRNARVGWVFAVVLFGSAVIAGWFVYRAFDEDPPGTEAAPVTSSPDTVAEAVLTESESAAESAAGSASPEEPPNWAGLTPVTAAADEPTATEFDTVPPGLTGPPPRIANRPAFRTVLYDLRVYDGIEPDATFWTYEVTYDTLSDDYYGFVTDSATGESELVIFNGEWRHSVGADGVNRRVRRSNLSLDSELDTPVAALLGETDVLPLEARRFATLLGEQAGEALGIDGSAITSYGYRLDLEAFRVAEPEAYLTWRQLWSTARLDNVDFIVPGTEQVRLSEVTPYDSLSDREQVDWLSLDVITPDGQAVVVFAISETGIVSLASVTAPEDDLRVVYAAHAVNDEPTILTMPDDAWVDAP